MPYLSADDGVRLWYQLDGREEAPLLVLSNSLGTALELWDPQMAQLERYFRVLRYDMRGHGKSDPPAVPYTMDRLGRDVLALLDALAVPRACFVGISMGGMIGLWLGLHAADRFERLALCNTAARIGPPDMWNKRIETVTANGMDAIVPAVIGRWFTLPFCEREPATVDRIAAMLRATPAAGYAAACAAIRDMDQRHGLAAIKARTLVITGSFDQATPAPDGRYIADQIGGARYVELAAAHLSNIEAADGFTYALTDFLTE